MQRIMILQEITFAFVKFLLLPFSILYGLVVMVRNILYNQRILKQTSFDFPIIGIGNLRVGGTGKTPMVMYLLQMMLEKKLKPGVVSRGYGRVTSGFKLLTGSESADEVGDEPALMKETFPNAIIAVDESRVRGIGKLHQGEAPIDLVLLDDAMQHRSVRPGLLIMLSAYSKLYLDDFILPVGRLREPSSSAERADIIIISKCPPKLDIHTRRSIRQRIKPMYHQKVFFSYEEYGELVSIKDTKDRRRWDILESINVLLFTGIADASFLLEFLEDKANRVVHLAYKDHHNYSETDIFKIKLEYDAMSSGNKLIITTEKDAQRLFKWIQNEKFADLPVYSIGHVMRFFKEDVEAFENRMDEFIRSYS